MSTAHGRRLAELRRSGAAGSHSDKRVIHADRQARERAALEDQIDKSTHYFKLRNLIFDELTIWAAHGPVVISQFRDHISDTLGISGNEALVHVMDLVQDGYFRINSQFLLEWWE